MSTNSRIAQISGENPGLTVSQHISVRFTVSHTEVVRLVSTNGMVLQEDGTVVNYTTSSVLGSLRLEGT